MRLETLLFGDYSTKQIKKIAKTAQAVEALADKYKNIARDVITPTIAQVAMPVLTELKEDKARQKQYYRKFMNVCALLIFPALLGLAVVFDDFCVLVLTEKWLPIVPYFRMLVVVALLDPFNGLANQILLVEGKTKQFFFSEFVRHTLLILSAYIFLINILFIIFYYNKEKNRTTLK